MTLLIFVAISSFVLGYEYYDAKKNELWDMNFIKPDMNRFYCKCNSSKEWEQLSNTPIAWLILTHDITMERSVCLLRRIWRPHHKYVIHVDKSVSHFDHMLLVQKIEKEFQEHNNIFVISVLTGGHRHELVGIELEMLRTIVRPWPNPQEINHYYRYGMFPELPSNASNSTCENRGWEYAAILSGDSYPLQDIDVIVRRISSSYSSINPLGMYYLIPKNLRKRFFKHSGKEILKVLESAYEKCGDKEKSSRLNALVHLQEKNAVLSKSIGAPVYFGLQWVILTRSFVEYSVTSELAHRLFDVLKYISYAGDEHYFQNLLFASCRDDFINDIGYNRSSKDLLVSHSSLARLHQFMYTPWGIAGGIMTPELVHKIHDDEMFTRKVRSTDTEQAIEKRIPQTRNNEEDFLHYCGGKRK